MELAPLPPADCVDVYPISDEYSFLAHNSGPFTGAAMFVMTLNIKKNIICSRVDKGSTGTPADMGDNMIRGGWQQISSLSSLNRERTELSATPKFLVLIDPANPGLGVINLEHSSQL